MLFGNNQPMTGAQLADLQRRRDAIRNAITRDEASGFAGGMSALGSALLLRSMDRRISNAFPAAPPAPGQATSSQQPAPPVVNRAQYQAGFDGRSIMGGGMPRTPQGMGVFPPAPPVPSNEFPSAPAAPRGQAMGANRLQYQPGFDGRSASVGAAKLPEMAGNGSSGGLGGLLGELFGRRSGGLY